MNAHQERHERSAIVWTWHIIGAPNSFVGVVFTAAQ